MRNDKHIAIKLRKQGKSYSKISKELNVPKSTLSAWLSDINWSRFIKIGLTRRANYIARKRLRSYNKKQKIFWEAWRAQARQQARSSFPKLKSNPLFISGIMIYWGEGDSKIENSNVRISNTNPDMIRVFNLFLRIICKVPKEKIKMAMILYPDLNEIKCKNFWSKTSGVPKGQFIKTQFIRGKHPTKRLTHGIALVYYPSRELKEKIFVWIELFHKQFPLMRV
ncbi:MAG: helix-turn-helix domain-containing protein [Parcubacteria group bacterium]|nr:helix-turn-helix domain-containing protein [Parcubacteria group bacterium]